MTGAASERGTVLATDLTGNLPCIGCGYDLNGLSVRALCPECGLAVRATILACVDPMAEELRPLIRPRVVAYGLIVWAWAAVAAAGSVWVRRLTDVAGIWFVTPNNWGMTLDAGLFFIALSGLAAVVLVRPMVRKNGWGTFKAGGAVLLYLPLLYVHFQLHGVYDRNSTAGLPYLGLDRIDEGRAFLRLAENMFIVFIVLGLREHAVSLAERSIVMRTGRVDTQPMTALVGTLALASIADVSRLVFGGVNGITGDLLMTFELILIAVGSFLFTLGLLGVGVDVLKLRPVLLRPSPGLTDVMAERDGHDDAG